MLTNIYLHGRLGKTFGKHFRLDIHSVSEGIRALCFLHKGFDRYLIESESHGFAYRVLLGKRELGEKELHVVNENKDIHLFPVPLAAAKKGVMQIVIGVVLVAAAMVTAGGSLTALGTMNGLYGGVMGGMFGTGLQMTAMFGTALIFGGISQLVANPKSLNVGTSDNSRSYIFSGSAQTSRQGGPVPVGYGKLHIGPQVISQGISTSNERRASVGNSGVEPADDGTGEGAYGAAASQVTYVRAAGTADFLGGIDHLGQPIVPVVYTELATA